MMTVKRDSNGRYPPGHTGNARGRPKKKHGVDEAVLGALSEKVPVTEQGTRKRKSKLDVTAAQLANKSAGGDLRATKIMLDQARKAEERAEARSVRAPVMTESDHEIAARVVARLMQFLASGGSDDAAEA